MHGQKTLIAFLILIIPLSLTAQESVVPGLLSQEIPNYIMRFFPSDISALPDTLSVKAYPNRIHAEAAYDYTISYRSSEKKIYIRRFSREFIADHHFSNNWQNPHRLSVYYREDASHLRIRSMKKTNTFRTENISRQWGLSYSRDFLQFFGFRFGIERMNGVNGGQWTYGAGLRFVNQQIEWSFGADRKFHSRESTMIYTPDTIFMPIDFAETECRIGLIIKNLERTNIEFRYSFNMYDSEYRKIKRFSALLDGTAETMEVRAARIFSRGIGFIQIRRNVWDYRIYSSKHGLQYGKMNVPELNWAEITAGMQYRISGERMLNAAYRYGYGNEHIGMIIDSWPFTTTLGNLLGAKNYSSIDGNIRLHSIFIQACGSIGTGQRIEPALGFIIASIHGRYAYRNQDAFFNVIERGKYDMKERKKYFNAGLSYRLTSQCWMIRMQIHQLIPAGNDKALYYAKNAKTYGGLFGRLGLTYQF